MIKSTYRWQLKSCLLLLLLAISWSGFSASPPENEKVVANPLAWTLTGRVVSNNGEPLPGVTVVVKGTPNGTATSTDGTFTLSVPETPGTMVVSFIGYSTQEIPFTGPGNFNIRLLEDAQALEEVVIIGYGTQRRQDLTGSVASVTEAEFVRGNVVTPEQLIVGKVAGVQITPGGAPGAGSRIRIRGGSSLSASNEPLVVIDGVPVDNTGIAGAANPLSFINPNDIASINILKDASATAIYGSRASNGVIIVTTKRGEAGQKLRVDVSSLASVSTIPRTIDVLSADEFRAAVNERGTATQVGLLGNANTDWQDLIYQTGISHDHNVGISGAFRALPYRLSLGYINQEGILKTSNFERTTATLSLNPSFFNGQLKVDLNLKGTLTNSRFANQGAIGSAIAFDPTQPVYADNQYGGYFEWVASGVPNIRAPRNPLSLLEQRNDRGQARRSIGNVQFDYLFPFLPALRANLNLGYDVSDSEGATLLPATMASVFAQGGSRSQYAESKQNKLLDFYLNYTQDLTRIESRVDVTAGYSYQDFIRTNPSFPVLTAEGNLFRPAAPFPFKTQNTLVSFFARANYSLLNRYLLTATVRQDGSSRFSPETRWGTFPSIALAWRINEEAFLRNLDLFSDLKLRLSYGITGQQDVAGVAGDYPYLPIYSRGDSSATYQLGDQFYQTLRPAGYDRNLKWEETEGYNAGLDFGFLEGRISGSVDVYRRNTKDLLALVPIPAGTNLTNQIITNVGNLVGKGVEAVLNFNLLNTERLNWDFGVNGTYNINTITNLSLVQGDTSAGIQVGGIGGGTGNTIQIHTVGFQPFSFYAHRQVYDESGRPVEGLYADLNRDGVINEQDLYRYKNPEPRVFLGISSQLAYDRFSFGFTMRGSIGNYLYNNVASNTGTYAGIRETNYLVNPTRGVQETGFTNYRYLSDYYLENASFLRMENINVGYDFGQLLNERVNLRLSANVLNAFVITKYTGLDPEVAGGIDNNVYPRPRIFSLGLNLGF
jgi:TonB-linked SusC/RagA family outer membrane protein